MKQEKEFLKLLGARIREIRLQRGWTLEQTEEKGFASWRHLQKIEAGKNFTMLTLRKICRVFGLSISELTKGL